MKKDIKTLPMYKELKHLDKLSLIRVWHKSLAQNFLSHEHNQNNIGRVHGFVELFRGANSANFAERRRFRRTRESRHNYKEKIVSTQASLRFNSPR